MHRACEFPCVAPSVAGRPHTHMYMVGSRFPGADAWGAPQVCAGGPLVLAPCLHLCCCCRCYPSLPCTASPPSLPPPTQVVCKVSVPPAAGVSQPAAAAAVDVYAPGPGAYAQEPIFVPRPGGTAEDDGWVMSLVFDSQARRTKLAILDARQLSGAPRAGRGPQAQALRRPRRLLLRYPAITP